MQCLIEKGQGNLKIQKRYSEGQTKQWSPEKE